MYDCMPDYMHMCFMASLRMAYLTPQEQGELDGDGGRHHAPVGDWDHVQYCSVVLWRMIQIAHMQRGNAAG